MVDRGRPAIPPRNNSVPSFSETDVRDYLSRNIPLGKIQVVGFPMVTQVVFATIRDIGRATADDALEANYPADMIVCYVELKGEFRVFGPPVHSRHAPTPTRSTAFIIFDARTGHIIVTGTPSRARWG